MPPIKRHRLVCLMLALVTVLVYLPVRHHEFISYDDPQYVQSNPIVQQGLTGRGVKWAFDGAHASNWHPLTWLSHMLDCELFGVDPGPAHLVNVILHAANAALVFLLLARLTGGFWPAAFAAAVFAWHPLRVESVAWISERKDVLSAFFGLLTLLAYCRYATSRRHRDFWLTLIFFALGLLAKPMLVTLPFVMLLLDYWPLQRTAASYPKPVTKTKLVLEKWPFFAAAVAACAMTVWAQHDDAMVPLDVLSMKLRLANGCRAYLAYLGQMLWPTKLCVFYPIDVRLGWREAFLAAAALGALSGLIWHMRRTRPYLLVGWLWFLGTLVPVIGLVQVGSQAMADRYTYIPMIGVLLALTAALHELAAQKRFRGRAPAWAGTAVLAGCLLLTHRQLPYWHDDVPLFARSLAVTTNNPIANLNLGVALERLGKKERAMDLYREALRITPTLDFVHNNLAGLLQEQGKNDEAEQHYQEALRLKPTAGMTHCNYGTFLVGLGQYDEAMQHFATAAQLRPWDPYPYYLMGKARMRQGRGAEAVIHFHKALRIDLSHLKTLSYLARLLATSEDAGVRNGTEAILAAERANELTGGQQAFVLDTLAAAYAEGGRFADAEQAIQRAMAASTAAGETDVVAEMQQRLKLYQSHQPYRESPRSTDVETERTRETGK